jgi:hypothetical protein
MLIFLAHQVEKIDSTQSLFSNAKVFANGKKHRERLTRAVVVDPRARPVIPTEII